jgi:gluconokinase
MLTYDQSPSFYGSTRAAGMASSAIPVSKAYVPSLKPRYRHLFIVTGPAGSGKSTVAKHLADRFMFPFIEGDEVSLIS